MEKKLITIRLNSAECIALEILLERLRERYADTRKVDGLKPGLIAYYNEFPVFRDEFDAVQSLDNVLRMYLDLKPFE